MIMIGFIPQDDQKWRYERKHLKEQSERKIWKKHLALGDDCSRAIFSSKIQPSQDLLGWLTNKPRLGKAVVLKETSERKIWKKTLKEKSERNTLKVLLNLDLSNLWGQIIYFLDFSSDFPIMMIIVMSLYWKMNYYILKT